ncbi:MAG: hypothetical protein KF746_18705 [Chitinophagaceae bacterium]|nr:hypothetical protein [Chitinophagaceae bacterium]
MHTPANPYPETVSRRKAYPSRKRLPEKLREFVKSVLIIARSSRKLKKATG